MFCAHCQVRLAASMREDAIYCSDRCRAAATRARYKAEVAALRAQLARLRAERTAA